MSDTSRVGLYYVPEVTWGEVPAGPPNLQELRYTNENLGQASSFINSNEIRPDRQVPDVTRTDVTAGGDVGFELSYGTYDDLLEALFASTWSVDGGGVGIDRLENGVVKRSFAIEKQFTDVSEFVRFVGMRIAQGSLTVTPGQILTGSFSFMGKNAVAAAATIGDGSPTAAPTTRVTNAVDNLSAVSEGGGAFTGHVMGITLNFNNTLRNKPEVGTLGPWDIGYGRSIITGSFNTYFETRALYEKFLNNTPSSMSFTVTDAAGNAYIFTIPQFKYTGGNPETPGNDEDVMLDLPFSAYRDPTTGVSIRLDRNPA